MIFNQSFMGDCLEIMPRLRSGFFDMILCDLPYGTTKCKWDSIIDLDKLWIQYKRLIKPNGAIVLTAQTPFDKTLGSSNLEMLKYEWIWEKTQATGHLNAKKMPMKAHENILIFYDKLPTYNPQITYGHKRKTATANHKRNCSTGAQYGKSNNHKDYDSTDRYPRSVQIFKSDKQKSKLHDTQKPVKLFEYLIKTYTKEGDIVLDNCAGSFTTAIACINTNRKFVCIEKEQKYFDIGQKRINEHNNG